MPNPQEKKGLFQFYPHNLVWVGLSIVAIILDQWTKHIASTHLKRYFFTSLAGLVSVIFVFWLMRMPKTVKILPIAIALILGGAIGNLIDRMSLGYVVDFIHVYYNNSHFPAFNIADSAITLGTILLLIDTFFLEKQRIQRAEAQKND